MTTFLSDAQFLSIGLEATAGTPVIPDIVVPLVSESIKTVVNHVADRRMKGYNWKANELLRGNRSHEGDIVILGDPENLGHILNMVMAKGSTSGDATNGYTHPFTVGSGKTYTIEITKGAYAQRYFGVYVEEMKIAFADNQMQITLTVKAMGQVSVMQLGAALSGAVTALVLDDNYDVAPNRGLLVDDVIMVGSNQLTLTSVNANGYGLGFTSTSLTYSALEPIYLKPTAVALAAQAEPFFLGNVLVGIGADESAATTAAGSRSTALKVYDLEISIKNNLFAQNGSSRLDPVQIIPKTPEAMVTLKQLLTSENQRTAFLHRTKQAMTIIAKGKNIKADFTTFELLTLIFNNVKLLESDNVLAVGDLISDTQQFEVLYDDSDAQAMEATIVNRTAGTEY